MISEWKTKKLSDIAKINPRESIKKGTLAKKIAMDKLQPFCRDIPSYELEKFNGGTKFKNGDTIMARITPCLENGKIAKVSILTDGEVGFGSTEYIVFRAMKNVDEDFLYYLIGSPIVREPAIKSMVGSSGRQRVQTDVLANLEIKLPTYEIQRRIGSILRDYDDKIAMNNAINRNLSEQALTIFTYMFGSAEKNSTVAEVSFNITDGVHNTVKDDPEGEFYLLSCKNIKGGSLLIGDFERRISQETFDKLRKRTKLEKGDILLSSVGTVGELLLLNFNPDRYEFQRSVAIIKPNREVISSEYLYYSLLAQKQEIIHAAHGAVQQCIFISDIKGFTIHKPTRDRLIEFDNIVVPMMEIVCHNEEENKRLSLLRDSLLPKFMSGELDVSELDI